MIKSLINKHLGSISKFIYAVYICHTILYRFGQSFMFQPAARGQYSLWQTTDNNPL